MRGHLARGLRTTPARLRVIGAALVAASIVLGLVAWGAERSRARAADAVATRIEPLLVRSVRLDASLSDAEATATTTFLTGGLELPARRQRYLADLRTASTALNLLTAEVANSPADRSAVRTIAVELPEYAALVESARAHNIEGQPVGAAYLRRASQRLKTSILPAADHLYTAEARRLGVESRSGTAVGSLIVFTLAMILLVAGLVLTQVHLTTISNRTLNLPLLTGTLLLLGLFLWALLGMLGEQSALARSQRYGSDPVEILSTVRILSSRAESDDSLSLVARGGDTTDPADARAVLTALGGPSGGGGLLHAAGRQIGPAAAASLGLALDAYRRQHEKIVALLGSGAVPEAIALAVGSAKSSSSPSDRLSQDLDRDLAAAQDRFVTASADATSSLSGLSVAIPVLILAGSGLALLGLRQRLREYL